MKRILSLLFYSLVCVGFLHCNQDTALPITNEQNNSYLVQIIDNSFIPDTLVVEPGSVIFFYNFDTAPHRILSQSAENMFDDTGEFDSGFFDPDSPASIEIPSSAVSGDIYYFYDDVLQDQMLTPNGSIEIR